MADYVRSLYSAPSDKVNVTMPYRELVVRYDRKAALYRAYVVLCAILLCLKRLLATD